MTTAAPRQSRGGHLQRVPPHDDTTERSLLGAGLLNGDAARVVTDVPGAAWYRPTHATIAHAIGHLVGRSLPVDPVTVSNVLRDRGQIDAVGGPGALVELMADTPSIGNAPTYAASIVEYARRRRIIQLGADVVEAVYTASDVQGLAAQMQQAVDEGLNGQPSSWEPTNIAAVLAGEGEAPEPGFLARSDGAFALYPGGLHAFNAPPESAKSWLALYACLERVQAGQHVLYIDFEDTPASVVERLLNMGAEPGELMERFHYLRPDEGCGPVARLRLAVVLRTWAISLAVVDSIGEGMGLGGLDENKAPDIYTFFASLPRFIQRFGVAVIVLDHVVKDREKQDGSGRGSGAKNAGIDAALHLRTIRPLGRDREGLVAIEVAKNRHGHLRGAALPATGKGLQRWADLVVRSTQGGRCVEIELRAPDPSTIEWEPTRALDAVVGLMADGAERMGRQVEDDLRAKGQRYRSQTVRECLSRLVDEGRLACRPGPRRAQVFQVPKETEGSELWENDF